MRKVFMRLRDISANEMIRRFNPLYRAFRFKPDMAGLNITDRCCLKCIMCSQWRQQTSQELSTEQWKDIICALKRKGVVAVNFSGGEPLLRKDLEELIVFAKELKLFVSVSTNGFLLDEDRAKALVKSGVDFFAISVDALGDNFDKIRGVEGAFKKVSQAIYFLKELKKEYPFKLQISYVLMKPSIDFFDEVYSYSVSMGAELVICLFENNSYFFKDGAKKEDFLFFEKDEYRLRNLIKKLKRLKKENPGSVCGSRRSFDYILEYFKEPRQPKRLCVISQKRILIDSLGNIYGGCWALGDIDNLIQKPLAEVLSSKKYKQRLKNMYFKKCAGCACGYIMNNRYFIDDYLKR
ncbi:MAG: radical SAM protein [Candidatus Omnitrophica bacterium]|nr:radical SAM protein [Candidatus Omnitrophota bacterium]